MKGPEIALELNERFKGRDWVADLANRSGETRDTVEWHLQQDMTPPDSIARTAAAMLEPGVSAPAAAEAMTKVDLPFAGVPEFIGRLHLKD